MARDSPGTGNSNASTAGNSHHHERDECFGFAAGSVAGGVGLSSCLRSAADSDAEVLGFGSGEVGPTSLNSWLPAGRANAGVIAWPSLRGVGSNGNQPNPGKNSSGHACASCVVTSQEPSGWRSPCVNPTATRDGIWTLRASTT